MQWETASEYLITSWYRYLLVGSSLTMGGVAIWAMHYIGNRAIVLYPNSVGRDQLQLVYSPGFTALSFFVPVIFLLLAYLLMGTASEVVGWVRLGAGGTFAGLSICGMHYLVCSPAELLSPRTVISINKPFEGASWYFQLSSVLSPRACHCIRSDCGGSNYCCLNAILHLEEELHKLLVQESLLRSCPQWSSYWNALDGCSWDKISA